MQSHSILRGNHMTHVNQSPKRLSRRDWLKVAGLSLGALAFRPFDGLFGVGDPVELNNPHGFVPVFAENLWTGMFAKRNGELDRVSAPPAYFQNMLDQELGVSIPWKQAQPGKPEFPEKCFVTFTDGARAELPIERLPKVTLAPSNEAQLDASRLNEGDAPGLRAIYDEQSRGMLITTEAGNIIRAIAPPQYQQIFLDQEYTTSIPYHAIGGKLTNPWGYAVVTTTQDGNSTSTNLMMAKSVKALLPRSAPLNAMLA